MIKRVLINLFNSFGYRIEKIPVMNGEYLQSRLATNLNLGYTHEEDAFEAIRIVSSYTMLPYKRLISLYEQVVYCEQNIIEGDFVECGTWKGGAVGLMALANMKFGLKRRNLHLFDSFTDICEPDERYDGRKEIDEINKILLSDRNYKGDLKPLTGIYDQWGGPGTLSDCKEILEKKIMYPVEKIYYHKGWFQDTLPVQTPHINAIAILRLDGDWYKSTELSLNFLYDKVVQKGIVIIDDFQYEGCRKATLDFISRKNIFPLIHHIDESCVYWIKQGA